MTSEAGTVKHPLTWCGECRRPPPNPSTRWESSDLGDGHGFYNTIYLSIYLYISVWLRTECPKLKGAHL